MNKKILLTVLALGCESCIITAKSALELVNIALNDPNTAKNQKELIDAMISIGDVFIGPVPGKYKQVFGDQKPAGLPSSFYKETDKAKKLDYITDNVVVPALQGVDQQSVKKFKQTVTNA